jgi:hypothetical protein
MTIGEVAEVGREGWAEAADLLRAVPDGPPPGRRL